MKNTYFWRYY